MVFAVNVVRDALIRARYKCEACGANWYDLPKTPGDAPIDAHSANSLHLVFDIEKQMYRATSVPKALSALKNRYFRPEAFRVYTLFDKRPDDAFCLCDKCHRKVHAIAREWTRRLLRAGQGGRLDYKNEIPNVLEYVTVMYVLNKTKWTPF